MKNRIDTRVGIVASWAGLSLLMASAGCTTTATILRRDGSTIEARIVDSSSDTIELRGYKGGRHQVDGRDVVDVDLPGNGALTVGLMALSLGVILATGGSGDEGTAATMLVLPGALMAAYGGYHYYRSSTALRNFRGSRTGSGREFDPNRTRSVPVPTWGVPFAANVSTPASFRRERPTPGLPGFDAPPPMPTDGEDLGEDTGTGTPASGPAAGPAAVPVHR